MVNILFGAAVIFLTSSAGAAQVTSESIPVSKNSVIEVVNPNGRITVFNSEVDSQDLEIKYFSAGKAVERKFKIETSASRILIDIPELGERLDIELAVPEFARLKIKTSEGQISASGRFAEVIAETVTGTIYADTEPENLRYKFLWTASYPRFMSDVAVNPIKEKTAGKHVIEGQLEPGPASSGGTGPIQSRFDFRTARGIMLLNVPPSQVPNDLLPKKMTSAARAIIRSGDSLLVGAIRRSAPDLFEEYASTLRGSRNDPFLTNVPKETSVSGRIKRVTVQVTEKNNRAFGGLAKEEFVVTERGVEREILDIKQTTTPFDLLLLIDVSGSVENYVDFIRKAGRSFVNTVDKGDRISIVTFNDDVKVLSAFSSDKDLLSKSLDTFDAGGGTALYDSIAFGLTESIRPLKGDRTAIVILSDGDDNRSFLPFEALIGSLQESGALVYPLYVPSNLIASTGDYSSDMSQDPLRDRYLTNNLSSKAETEGARLAEVSGGIYYPITKLSQLQQAYDDIVVQLRTAYTITFRSEPSAEPENRVTTRLRVRVKRDDAFVKVGPVTAVVEN